MVAFLEELERDYPDLAKLMIAGLHKLRSRNFHRPPLTQLVDAEDDIFELRVGHANIARAFFFFRRGREIIVTNGYVKKQQKLDPRALERARTMKRDWEARHP